jgi:hypothetical protein
MTRETYLLYVVPETQPPPGAMARRYGGYHITIFPSNVFDEKDYTIGPIMEEFTRIGTRTHWKPRFSRYRESKDLQFMDINSDTLGDLMITFQEMDSRWSVPQTYTTRHHLTLGIKNDESNPSPRGLFSAFERERNWNVQLVHKRVVGGKLIYEWVEGETYPLFKS